MYVLLIESGSAAGTYFSHWCRTTTFERTLQGIHDAFMASMPPDDGDNMGYRICPSFIINCPRCGVDAVLTEYYAYQSKDDQLADDQKTKISSSHGPIQMSVGQGPTVLRKPAHDPWQEKGEDARDGRREHTRDNGICDCMVFRPCTQERQESRRGDLSKYVFSLCIIISTIDGGRGILLTASKLARIATISSGMRLRKQMMISRHQPIVSVLPRSVSDLFMFFQI